MLTISALIAAFILASPVRAADIIISMNDNHTVLDETGAQIAATPMRPDTVDFIDIGFGVTALTAVSAVTVSAGGPYVSAPLGLADGPDAAALPLVPLIAGELG